MSKAQKAIEAGKIKVDSLELLSLVGTELLDFETE